MKIILSETATFNLTKSKDHLIQPKARNRILKEILSSILPQNVNKLRLSRLTLLKTSLGRTKMEVMILRRVSKESQLEVSMGISYKEIQPMYSIRYARKYKTNWIYMVHSHKMTLSKLTVSM